MARCPADPAHGPVIALESTDHRYGWHCPNQRHDGRPKSHPEGESKRTRPFFTTEEVDRGSVAEATS